MILNSAGKNVRKRWRSKKNEQDAIKYEALNSQINIIVRMINFNLNFKNLEKKNLQKLEKVSHFKINIFFYYK